MQRLDKEIISRNIAPSRTLAAEYIKQGFIKVNDKIETKCSKSVDENDIIDFTGEKPKFVGRGGMKLERAIENFSIDLKGKKALDAGSSTGGFSDCMIQYGAAEVTAVDVGTGQFDRNLAKDKRIILMERTDIRNLDMKKYSEYFDFAGCDVSFISFEKVFDSIISYIKKDGEYVQLIKPQFEVGKSGIGKNGIVKDKKLHLKTLENAYEFITAKGCTVLDACKSPIKGGSGNIEYLFYIRKSNQNIEISKPDLKKIISDEF